MSRTVIVVTGIFPPDSGGPAKFSSEFGSWCTRKNIEIKVVTYSSNSSSLTYGELKYPVQRSDRSISLVLRYFRMIFNIGRNSRNSAQVLAAGAFLETYFASLIFRFRYVAKVPGDIVWERARNNQVSNLGIDEFQKARLPFKYLIFRRLFTQSLNRASVVIVPSIGLMQLCKGWGVPEYKLRLIRNSVAIEDFPAGKPSNIEFDLTTVCRLVSWKGVDALIRYSSTRGLRMAVIGDGPERQTLQNLSDSLGAQVKFFGDIPERDVSKLLRKSQIFALNSSYEGLPHALVEARACGLISVARAGTGSAEVINDGIDGFLVRNDRNLDQTLDLALSTSKQPNGMGEKASQDSRLRFSRESNFKAILEVLSEVQP